MKIREFGKTLKQWRGKRLQKEVAAILEVDLRIYEGWEFGKTPSRFVKNVIKRQMQQHPEK